MKESQVGVRLPEDVRARLEVLAGREETTISTIVRRAVRSYLTRGAVGDPLLPQTDAERAALVLFRRLQDREPEAGAALVRLAGLTLEVPGVAELVVALDQALTVSRPSTS